MIISHKYKFIFIKTYKTAGTSIEIFLSRICGEDDILTPIYPHVEIHRARNYIGLFNPINEINNCNKNFAENISTLKDFLKRRMFYNHISACKIRSRINKNVWMNYFKFTVERNPWDKTISMYYMYIANNIFKGSFSEYLKFSFLPINYPLYLSKKDEILVDKFIYFEKLEEGLEEVFSQLGIKFSGLNVRAKSNYRFNKDYRILFTEKWQREMIYNKFKPEIELHGYDF